MCICGAGVVQDIYAKYDAINLARERTYNNLDVPVSVVLRQRKDFEGVKTCTLNDTLGEVRPVLQDVECTEVTGADLVAQTWDCLGTDFSSASTSLLHSDFIESGVVDLECRRLVADLESVAHAPYVWRRSWRGSRRRTCTGS